MTNKEKAERYDVLMFSLEFYKKRYAELSERIEKSLPEGNQTLINAFDKGMSVAYSYFVQDIQMLLGKE